MPLTREEVDDLKAQIRARTLATIQKTKAKFPRSLSAGFGLTAVEDQYRLAIRVGDSDTRKWFETNFEDLLVKLDKDVDIRQVDPPVPLPAPDPNVQAAQAPPLAIGMGIRHVNGGVGTLGFFARRQRKRGFVSCNHVIALRDEARNGDEIHSEVGDRAVGRLARFHKLRFIRAGRFRPYADCAFAEVDPSSYPQQPGRISGVGDLTDERPFLRKEMTVYKIGRSTQKTRGMITSTDYDSFFANFNSLFFATFDNLIEIESAEDPNEHGEIPPFASGGDSGSLVWTDDRRPAGMIFYVTGGGVNGAGLTYANPIHIVEKALRLRIDTTV